MFILLFCVFSLFIGGAPPDRSNVLLITVNTLRADRVSCYDGSNLMTPHFENLAEQGVAFTHGFSAYNTAIWIPLIISDPGI